MLCSLAFTYVGVISLQREVKFTFQGKTAPGVVLSKKLEERWSTDSTTKRQVKTTYYSIRYTFTASDGKEHEALSGVSSSVYENSREGEPIEIQYLAENPNKSRVQQDPEYVFGGLFTLFGILLFLVGAVVLRKEVKARLAKT